ncbi:hypothetical protein SAMN05421805_12532 [Saccharopolyspora antimicrobica]|uniref:Uncharacterized protein n=1 Tax=Saccharopolyspora antimicrobica TaxID=455193 RepID=A0A1I5K4F1_9PSEU|nr:hypothetical protein [Saccharopolyspora antimicrobica]RKT84772.1 hypothetical protein ATL45_3097 [Saccharopolyspora antimicrobica]SFO79466.1 hypothetical protein SAMN05421805_12532 [Saccharopolyspora antimicrobica]
MAGENEIVSIPPDLKQKFAALAPSELALKKACRIWEGMDAELQVAAGNDDETARSIKKEAKNLNSNITGMLDSLSQLFNLTTVKGQKAADNHDKQSDYNSHSANSIDTGN